MAAATGKRASCLFKKRQQPKPPSALSPGYANEVSAGWPALNGAARDWTPAVGEGLGVDDSWDPASQEQADREREREKKESGRGRARRERERERERGRQAHRLHNARLGLVLMCFLFWHVFLKFCEVWWGEGFGCGAAPCVQFPFYVQR